VNSNPVNNIVDLRTDIVCIGAGGTGLAAAVAAGENGAKVIVLEKRNSPGGTLPELRDSLRPKVQLRSV